MIESMAVSRRNCAEELRYKATFNGQFMAGWFLLTDWLLSSDGFLIRLSACSLLLLLLLLLFKIIRKGEKKSHSLRRSFQRWRRPAYDGKLSIHIGEGTYLNVTSAF